MVVYIIHEPDEFILSVGVGLLVLDCGGQPVKCLMGVMEPLEESVCRRRYNSPKQPALTSEPGVDGTGAGSDVYKRQVGKPYQGWP